MKFKYSDLLLPLWREKKVEILVLFLITMLSIVIETLTIGLFYPYLKYVMQGDSFEIMGVSIFFEKHTNSIILITLLLIALNIIRFLVALFAANLQAKRAYEFQSFISNSIVSSYLVNIELNRDISKSDFIRKLISDVSILAGGFYLPIMFIITEILVSLAIFSFLLYTSPVITIISFVILSIMGSIAYMSVRNKLYSLGKLRLILESDRALELDSTFEGLREIRFRRLQHQVCNLIGDLVDKICDISANQQVLGAFPRYFLELVCYVGIIIFAFYLGSGNQAEFVALAGLFGLAILRMLPSANRIINSLNQLRFCAPTIYEISLDIKKSTNFDLYSRSLPAPIDHSNQFLAFRSKDLQYQSGNISFSVPPFDINFGEWVQLAGESGVGKSVFLDLVTSFNPKYGDYFSWNLKFLGERLQGAYYLSQKSFIREGSIYQNLVFGCGEANFRDIMKCLEVVDFKNANEEYIKGTSIKSLSGGELQRISLARALLTKPSFMLMDEPTSSLDTASSRKILQNIKSQYPKLAVLIISHNEDVSDVSDKRISIERIL
jgi:ABC-type transport system involved in cytochrome bd biosynthesis fused ATPase/permease subunit